VKPQSQRPLFIRIILSAAGGLLLLVGLLGWFLPLMPGWPFVIAGLAILAGEFVWARRLLDQAREQLGRMTPPTPLYCGVNPGNYSPPMEALTPEEARILGCLVEKERTTPEYYPMTVNALVAAANQKTNRHPVVEYDEPTIERTLRSLDDKGLAGLTRARGGRTLKYLQKAEDAYEVDSDQLAILAVLLLRGPQTPGELRSRTARYFVAEQPLDAIESLLEDLMTSLVERLPREPGQKENRFRDLLTDPATVVPEAAGAPAPVADPLTDRVAVLERRVAALARSLGVEFNDLDQSFE
jgi:uncharacterized protein YceH (UPF0502 family)